MLPLIGRSDGFGLPGHRRTSRSRHVRCSVAVILALTVIPRSLAAEPPLDFARDVLPVLSENCFQCHGPDANTREADLRLDTREGALRTERPVIVPGDSGASEFVRRLTSADPDEQMPPPSAKKRITPAQRQLLQRWIEEGAAWGRHWAYEPPARPPLPAVRDSSWPRHPIDAFILARLEEAGLQPAPEAPLATLIRRVTMDLTGLPPAPAEIDAVLADERPNAYELLVDRLLESPRYGERMAWDWLDAARYADSNGYQGDPERTMWPWRDGVIAAFNRSQPYDQFTIEQLAGDLLPDATLPQRIATGFNRNHMYNGEGGRIAEETRVENVFDRAETTATVWLGVTLTCCRCHDHKFDPFSMRDYFGFYAFFNNTSETGDGRSGQVPPVVEYLDEVTAGRRTQLQSEWDALARQIAEQEASLFPREQQQPGTPSGEAAGLSKELQDDLKKSPAQRDAAALQRLLKQFQETQPEYAAALSKLKQLRDQREALNRSIPKVMVMDERAELRETRMLVRGAYNQTSDPVTAAVPASLPALRDPGPANRLSLARWLVAPEQPLTARVTVNRYWQTVFGTGLVKTAEDFGVQGEGPSHPQLLDWLAVELQQSGWDVKALHRMLVTSATYRQSSQLRPELAERDPDNRLLARSPRFRWPSWMLRDQALAVSGLAVGELGGPPVQPYQPEGIWEEATFGKKQYRQDHGASLYRRSLYVFWRRIVGPTMFFDTSARQVCSIKPSRTNTPLQALVTLNDVTYVEAARAMAQRLLTDSELAGEPARLAAAFRLVTARYPAEAEGLQLAAALADLRREFQADSAGAARLLAVGEYPRDTRLEPVEHAAWTSLCLLIMNLDESVSRE